MNQLVSICIPVYNGEKYLRECLDSVINQTYKNLEIIIVDDFSADASVEIIQQYMNKDERIRLYKNKSNKGLVANWNKCLEIAGGEWIKFTFQDDLLAINCIEKMVFAAGGHAIVVSDRTFIFDESVSKEIKDYFENKLLTLKRMLNTSESVFISDRKIAAYAVKYISLNFIGEPTAVLFRRKMVNEIGSFNTTLSQICDLEYWLRIATNEGLVYVPENLVSFRIHASSQTTSNITGDKNFKANYFDTVILAYELNFNKSFSHFRSHLTTRQKNKLLLYLKVKLYEAQVAAEQNPVVNNKWMDESLHQYPGLKRFYKASLKTKIAYRLVKLKRKFK